MEAEAFEEKSRGLYGNTQIDSCCLSSSNTFWSRGFKIFILEHKEHSAVLKKFITKSNDLSHDTAHSNFRTCGVIYLPI